MPKLTPSRAAAAAPIPIYITRLQLCRRWGISRGTSYRFEREGHLPPAVRLGPGTWRWPLAEIEKVEAGAVADRRAGGR